MRASYPHLCRKARTALDRGQAAVYEQDMKTIYRLEVTAPEDAYERLSGLLALEVSSGWEEESLPTGETRFRIHCEREDLLRQLQATIGHQLPDAVCVLAPVEEQDWLAAWREFFTPVCCGSRFVVLPPWLADQAEHDFPGRTPILIEPKSAFGTGHHATTALCLHVISDLLDAGKLTGGKSFLDLGTGSGVLGVGCCLSGLHGQGLDIDPLAVDNAQENRQGNGIAPEAFVLAQGSMECVQQQYDLVLANILARPLTEMAPDIVRACAPGGCLVLSGLLEIQAEGVERAYRNCGLPAARRMVEGEWCALIWDDIPAR